MDAAASEGDPVVFTVALTGTRTGSVTVSYATTGGTARQGSDYTQTSGTLTFATNESSKSISVPTVEDDIEEQTETFTVTLSNPGGGATIQDGTATGTITDDDGTVTALPLLNIIDDTVEEGEQAQFTVTLSRTSTRTVTVDYATADGTAQQGSDYTAASGTLRFAPGEASKTIPVPTVEDTVEEQTETFTITLSNLSGATIQDATATGTITDDEPVTPLPTLTITDTEVKEGDMTEFLVTLRPASDRTATVSFRTVDGTAAAGFDYTSTMGRYASSQAKRVRRLPCRRRRVDLPGGPGVDARAGHGRLVVPDDGDTLGAVRLEMRRVRLSTEASYEHLFSFGSILTPWGELGLRHDGGDAETGAGLEVRAGLRYRYLPQGLTIEGYGRRLVVHEGAVRESGFGAVLRVDPGESGLGPSMSVTPAWGATASGVNQLWEHGASGFSMLDAPGTRMNAHFAYGLPALNGGANRCSSARTPPSSFGRHRTALPRRCGVGRGLGDRGGRSRRPPRGEAPSRGLRRSGGPDHLVDVDLPGNHESAGKRKSGRTGHGNKVAAVRVDRGREDSGANAAHVSERAVPALGTPDRPQQGDVRRRPLDPDNHVCVASRRRDLSRPQADVPGRTRT